MESAPVLSSGPRVPKIEEVKVEKKQAIVSSSSCECGHGKTKSTESCTEKKSKLSFGSAVSGKKSWA